MTNAPRLPPSITGVAAAAGVVACEDAPAACAAAEGAAACDVELHASVRIRLLCRVVYGVPVDVSVSVTDVSRGT